MSVRLTDGQLRTFAVRADYPLQDAATELLALRERVKELEAWAKEWRETAETICLLAGVSQGLGAGEMVVAFRDTNDALRAEIAAKEREIARLEELVSFYRKAFPTEADMAQRAALNALKGNGDGA
jgi:hypothetical protein